MLLRKGVYTFEYMDDWEKFNETTLSEKEEFYSNLTYPAKLLFGSWISMENSFKKDRSKIRIIN